MKNAHQHTIFTNDGQELALWCLQSKSSVVDPVEKDILLIHGTFSNHTAFTGITQYLVKNGYRCWILDWRGHGESQDSKKHYDMETVGRYDIRAAFDFLDEQGVRQLDCITHSGGGISLTIFLTENEHEQKMINSITMFACQAFGCAQRKRNHVKVFLGKQISKTLGYVPGKFAGVKGENESYYMMEQWFNWNLSGRFISREGIDIGRKMSNIRTPVFAISADGDIHIAPPSGCLAFMNTFQNPNNRFIRCGTNSGFSEEFNHSRVLQSRNAAKEIWPLVLDWVGQNQDP